MHRGIKLSWCRAFSGLASYMRKYAYSNAETDGLWAALEDRYGEPVENLMTTWTKQQGYPVISAKLKGNYLVLEQAQFLLNGFSGSGMWTLPITLGCGTYDAQKKFLLKGKSYKLDIKDIAPRVTYDDELAGALQNALQANKLSIMDKIGIVEDSHALSMACKRTVTSLLQLLYAYREETDYTVVSHIHTVSLSVAKISVDATPGLFGDIKQLLIKLLLPRAEKLGWDPKEGESHLDAMLRPDILDALVKLGHDKTVLEGIRRFHIFVQDRNTLLLPPDTRNASYLAVMQNVTSSNRSGYDDLLKVYRRSTEAEEKEHVLSTLCSCKDKNIVLESLNFLFSNEGNWDGISKIHGDILTADFITYVFRLFTSNEKAAEFSRFFASRKKPGFERTLKQGLENIQINARWVQCMRSEPKLAQTVRELLQRP